MYALFVIRAITIVTNTPLLLSNSRQPKRWIPFEKVSVHCHSIYWETHLLFRALHHPPTIMVLFLLHRGYSNSRWEQRETPTPMKASCPDDPWWLDVSPPPQPPLRFLSHRIPPLQTSTDAKPKWHFCRRARRSWYVPSGVLWESVKRRNAGP